MTSSLQAQQDRAGRNVYTMFTVGGIHSVYILYRQDYRFKLGLKAILGRRGYAYNGSAAGHVSRQRFGRQGKPDGSLPTTASVWRSRLR